MTRFVTTFLASILISACCHAPASKTIDSPGAVQAHEVLNALKDELALFASTAPNTKPTGKACKGPNGLQVVGIVPQTASLSLKVIGTDLASGSAGVNVPIGSVLTVNPTLTSTYTRIGTEQVTLGLNIDHDKTTKELRAEIESLQKEVDGDQKYLESHKSKVRSPSDVDYVNKRKSEQILRDFNELVAAEKTGTGASVGRSTSAYSAELFKDHPIAQALYSMREELLAINHDKTPCLKPDTLKVEVDFQVTKKLDASGKITFLIVSLGGEHARTDDTTQSLIVTFDLADKSTMLFQ